MTPSSHAQLRTDARAHVGLMRHMTSEFPNHTVRLVVEGHGPNASIVMTAEQMRQVRADADVLLMPARPGDRDVAATLAERLARQPNEHADNWIARLRAHFLVTEDPLR